MKLDVRLEQRKWDKIHGCTAANPKTDMKANFDHAVGVAMTSHQVIGADTPNLAILISCVRRILVLKQQIE